MRSRRTDPPGHEATVPIASRRELLVGLAGGTLAVAGPTC